MTKDRRASDLVLGIHPTTTGFGWAIFKSPIAPVEWGNATVSPDRNKHALKRIQDLIERYRPSEIVLEQFEGEPARRHSRIRRLYRAIVELSKSHGIEPRILTREAIEQVFAKFEATSRYDIASVIAAHVKEFAHLLPPKRKCWLPEDRRMGLFNAAALAIAFFALIDDTTFAD
jgi:Holliday junction resolvasome RuvABC endonuclease subunit